MNPTTNPMTEMESINPLRHKYYSIIRDMYHPFLYDNYFYCEMSDQRLHQMLEERDIYVKTIQINVMDALLTDQERDWVHFLRNSCLFEVHRRRYKLVLNDLMAYVRHIEDRKFSLEYEITPYFKVWQWLRRNEYSPMHEPDQEDLEYQNINNQAVISFAHPVRHVSHEIQRRAINPYPAQPSRQEVVCQILFQRLWPAPSEPPDDYYAAFESADGSDIINAEEMGNMTDGMGNTVFVRESEAQQVSGNYGKVISAAPEKHDPIITIPNYEINRATTENDERAYEAPEDDETAYEAPEDDEAACTAPEVVRKVRSAPANYGAFYSAPETREIACGPTADVACQAEVHLVPQNDEAAALPLETKHGNHNVAPTNGREKLILYEEYPRDFFYAHPELFEIHTVESLGKLMCDREYIKQREGRKEELKEMARKREIALAEYYAKKAQESDAPREIASAVSSAVTVTIDDDDEDATQSSSTSSDVGFKEPLPTYDNDAQLPSTSYYSNDRQVRSVSDYHLDFPLASASYCSATTMQSVSHHTNDSPRSSASNYDSSLPFKSVTADITNLPPTSSYNNNDRSKGAIRKQYYTKVPTCDATPPPVPEFFPSSKGSVTMDSSDFRELESDNTYYLWYLKETGQLSKNGSDETEGESEPPELPKVDIPNSDEEIDCTLPPIEPDFMNLPLPELPEDKK